MDNEAGGRERGEAKAPGDISAGVGEGGGWLKSLGRNLKSLHLEECQVMKKNNLASHGVK